MKKYNVIRSLAVIVSLILLMPTVESMAASTSMSSLAMLESVTDRQLSQTTDLLEDINFEEEYDISFAKTKWKTNFSKSDLRYMAALIFAEANGMGFEAKAAVGNVVLNRMYDEKSWGHVSTVYEVIYDKKWGTQFTPTKDGSMKRALAIYDSMDPATCKEWQIRAMNECIEAAKAVLKGYRVVPDNFFYFNSHLEATSKTCRENNYSFVILDRHIYYNKVSSTQD